MNQSRSNSDVGESKRQKVVKGRKMRDGGTRGGVNEEVEWIVSAVGIVFRVYEMDVFRKHVP